MTAINTQIEDASGLREFFLGMGFVRLDEILFKSGLYKKNELIFKGKRAVVYATPPPRVTVMLLIPTGKSGFFDFLKDKRLLKLTEVYVSGDFQQIEKKAKIFPHKHIRMNFIGAFDPSTTGDGKAVDIIRDTIKKVKENKKYYSIDLHSHGCYGESLNTFLSRSDNTTRYAFLFTGLDGMAVTPHYSVREQESYLDVIKASQMLKRITDALGENAKNKFGQKVGFLVLNGIEYNVAGTGHKGKRADGKHIIAIYPEHIDLSKVTTREVTWSVPDALNEIHKAGGLAIAAHPLMPGNGLSAEDIKNNITSLDGIEIRNGTYLSLYKSKVKVRRAYSDDPKEDGTEVKKVVSNELAEKLGRGMKEYKRTLNHLDSDKRSLALTGGSDCHEAWHAGICSTLVHAKEFTYEAVFNAIKEGKTEAVGENAEVSTVIKRVGVATAATIIRDSGIPGLGWRKPTHRQRPP